MQSNPRSEEKWPSEPLGTVAIETHGCKLNLADSERIAAEFSRLGYTVVDPGQSADVYVLNTCTVTRTADGKARQALRAARRRSPDALVVATGCYAQRAAQELRDVSGVALVAGNSRKAELVEEVLRLRGQTPSPRTVGCRANLASPAASDSRVRQDPGGLQPGLRLLHRPPRAGPRAQHPALGARA